MPQSTVGSQAINLAGSQAVKAQAKSNNFIAVGFQIAQKEGILALYKGLGAVISGIVPKQAIRFSSFDFFKRKLAGADGKTNSAGIYSPV